MRYGVRFASDDEMPEGHDALVIRSDDEAIVVYRESVVSRRAVTTAWESLQAVASEAAARPVPDDELMPRRLSRQRGEQPPFRVIRGRLVVGGC